MHCLEILYGTVETLNFIRRRMKGRMKYYTKYKVNATSILDVGAENRVISTFLVLTSKYPLGTTVHPRLVVELTDEHIF